MKQRACDVQAANWLKSMSEPKMLDKQCNRHSHVKINIRESTIRIASITTLRDPMMLFGLASSQEMVHFRAVGS